MKQLFELDSWQQLEKHAESFQKHPLLSTSDSQLSACNITLDYSSQHLTKAILRSLIQLAQERNLREKMYALTEGGKINYSENRAALHTALRSQKSSILIDNKNIMPDILAARKKIHLLSEQIRQKKWFGFSGQVIKDIVNIGIGGSDLGPRFCINALAEYCSKDLGYHFISDADPNAFSDATKKLHPETTLFIVSSKSFTTEETLYNAKKAKVWIGQQHLDKHFIAITANEHKAHEFGIANTIPIWNWIGGRYSMCSAINLITAIAIGYEQFEKLLTGARKMDEHFIHCEFEKNLPVLLALSGIWNINFLHINNLLILNYARQLNYLVPYIQQLDMESNGKSINHHGKTVNYATGPIIWGGAGNQAQHSYFQSLCQGTHKVSADIIRIKSFDNELINHLCNKNMHVLTNGVNDDLHPNHYIPGQTPVNHICLENCSPYVIGALIALYEHKVFCQSVIWGINPFDQPGVESAKRVKLKEPVSNLITA